MAGRVPSYTAADETGLLRFQTVPTPESNMEHMLGNVSEQVVPVLSHVRVTTPVQEVPEVESVAGGSSERNETEDEGGSDSAEFLQGIQSVLSTLPGVNPSKALQNLEQMVQEMELEEEEGWMESTPHHQVFVPYSQYPLFFPSHPPSHTPRPSPPPFLQIPSLPTSPPTHPVPPHLPSHTPSPSPPRTPPPG